MGIKFASETDTEVIAQLIGLYLDKGMETKEAVVHALKRLVILIFVCYLLINWYLSIHHSTYSFTNKYLYYSNRLNG